jgi:hypothetical protein
MQRVYPRDVFPSAWMKLDELASNGALISSEQVLEELRVQDDGAHEWALRKKDIFWPLDAPIQKHATLILAKYGTLIDLRKRKSGADPFVVATAIQSSSCVVTEERPSGGPGRVKIPDVCKAYKVECICLLEMLRREGLRV